MELSYDESNMPEDSSKFRHLKECLTNHSTQTWIVFCELYASTFITVLFSLAKMFHLVLLLYDSCTIPWIKMV